MVIYERVMQMIRALLTPKVSKLLLVLWAGTVLWLSLVPIPELPRTFWGFDKVEHVMAYMVLAFLLRRTRWSWAGNLGSVLAVVAFGCTVEILQSFHPPREASVWDAVANAIGSVMGTLVANRI